MQKGQSRFFFSIENVVYAKRLWQIWFWSYLILVVISEYQQQKFARKTQNAILCNIWIDSVRVLFYKQNIVIPIDDTFFYSAI